MPSKKSGEVGMVEEKLGFEEGKSSCGFIASIAPIFEGLSYSPLQLTTKWSFLKAMPTGFITKGYLSSSTLRSGAIFCISLSIKDCS